MHTHVSARVAGALMTSDKVDGLTVASTTSASSKKKVVPDRSGAPKCLSAVTFALFFIFLMGFIQCPFGGSESELLCTLLRCLDGRLVIVIRAKVTVLIINSFVCWRANG